MGMMNRESEENLFLLHSISKSVDVLSSVEHLMHKHIKEDTSDGSFFYQKDSRVCRRMRIIVRLTSWVLVHLPQQLYLWYVHY